MKTIVNEIKDSKLKITDFAKAVEGLKVNDAGYHLLLPAFSKVLDEVFG